MPVAPLATSYLDEIGIDPKHHQFFIQFLRAAAQTHLEDKPASPLDSRHWTGEIFSGNRIQKVLNSLMSNLSELMNAQTKQSHLGNVPVSIDQTSYEYNKAMSVGVFTLAP